jgi:hypothetical protein
MYITARVGKTLIKFHQNLNQLSSETRATSTTDNIRVFLVTSCNLRPCYPGVSCTDTPDETPGYQCGKCPMGMKGDGMNCTDIDEVGSSSCV